VGYAACCCSCSSPSPGREAVADKSISGLVSRFQPRDDLAGHQSPLPNRFDDSLRRAEDVKCKKGIPAAIRRFAIPDRFWRTVLLVFAGQRPEHVPGHKNESGTRGRNDLRVILRKWGHELAIGLSHKNLLKCHQIPALSLAEGTPQAGQALNRGH
jgi:hypothetical protein